MPAYGIIGYPLTHSFSKKYFDEKFVAEKITDARFGSYPISSISEFPSLLAKEPDLKGLSVTIPYKEQVLQYATELSPEVAEIGAANCLRIHGDQVTAFNTDIIGFERSFVKHLQPGHDKALLLGTGGASKAVQFVLKKLGIKFLVVSREKKDLTGYITYKDVTGNFISEYRIIINASPVGMFPNVDNCPGLDYAHINSQHYLYDLVYNPEKTMFLKRGEEKGATIQNGFEMLLIQAEENWRIWNEEA
jgi:shikimate dehydrogenase